MNGRRQAREEAERSSVAQAWYVEAFRRSKRLPSLDMLLRDPSDFAVQTPDDMMALLLQFQAGGASMEVEEVEDSWLLQ